MLKDCHARGGSAVQRLERLFMCDSHLETFYEFVQHRDPLKMVGFLVVSLQIAFKKSPPSFGHISNSPRPALTQCTGKPERKFPGGRGATPVAALSDRLRATGMSLTLLHVGFPGNMDQSLALSKATAPRASEHRQTLPAARPNACANVVNDIVLGP